MTRFDRYITIEFLRVFFICFATFLGLFVIADFVNHFDEIVRYAKKTNGMLPVLWEYYGPKVPWFFDFIGRIVGLVAAVFTVTSLQKNNELAAMMAAGIRRWRIIKPLVVAVAVVAVLGALNRELLIPWLGNTIYQDARNLGEKPSEDIRAQYDHETGIFIDGGALRPTDQAIENPVFDLPTDLAPRGTVIVAKRARRVAPSADKPSGFLMEEVDAKRSGVQRSIFEQETAVVYHPNDFDWLEKDQLFVATDLPFAQLRNQAHWKRCSSTMGLIRVARNESLDTGADVSVSIHMRVLKPVIDVLVLFLGLPVVLSRESRNAFIAIGSCMLMVGSCIVTVIILQGLGLSYVIPPSLAAWAPVMVFIPVAVWMSEPLRR